MELQTRELVGDFYAPNGKIAIVASRFNDTIVNRLIEGAQDALLRHGVKASQIEVAKVPGAYEIPLACQRLAQTHRYDGIIALGTVIRGATAHFDYVAGACANGILQVQLATNVPILFGVLTTESIEQAVERSGTIAGNKGYEAAMGLLEMINLFGKIND